MFEYVTRNCKHQKRIEQGKWIEYGENEQSNLIKQESDSPWLGFRSNNRFASFLE